MEKGLMIIEQETKRQITKEAEIKSRTELMRKVPWDRLPPIHRDLIIPLRVTGMHMWENC